jgi:phosphoribosyl 1,2-cyclic phosphate phosphodiesterase
VRVVFLGTATSYGVPQVGCTCATCRSTDPRNKRTRASVYLELDDGVNLLIDSGPELRVQALREGIARVDAVLYTHYHADHTAAIDDLKAFNAQLEDVLPCYGDAATGASLRHRFGYAFEGTPWVGLIPHIIFTEVDDQPFTVGNNRIQPVPLRHGNIRATGYRIGDFAYLTDTNQVPATSKVLLQGLEVMVVDTFRWEPHPTHMSVPEVLALSDELRPRRTLMTHLSHRLEHVATNARLPEGVELAYDGLRLEL